nr:hypothetical protein 5 [bacterium]
MKINFKRLTLLFLIFLASWGILCIFFMQSDDLTPLDDEPGFLRVGKTLLTDGIEEGKLVDRIWIHEFANYGLNNPKVGTLTLGLINIAANSLFVKNTEKQLRQKFIFMRSVTSAFSAVGLVFIFLLMQELSSIRAGFISVVLLIINPTFRFVASSLLPDVVMFLFLSMALFCLNRFFKKFSDIVISWFWLVAFFMALTMSCRMYGVAVYLFFILLLFTAINENNYFRVGFCFFKMTALTGVIFLLTNPPFFMDFFRTFKALTFGHMEVLKRYHSDVLGRGKEMFFIYPYILYRGMNFGIEQVVHRSGMGLRDLIFVVLSYFLILKHIFSSIKVRKFFLLFFYAAANIWLIYPFFTLGANALNAKSLFLIAIAVTLIVGMEIDNIFKSLYNGLIKK